MHQAIEGAVVGAHNYVFRPGPQTILGQALPTNVAAVLSGHIHRAQVLDHDLAGRPLPAPVIYPGSTSRTSRAERFETKGYRVLELTPGAAGGRVARNRFVALDRVRPTETQRRDSTFS